jgi:hypothetical protein
VPQIPDWNGRSIEVLNSQLDESGTWLVLDYGDNLIRTASPEPWPPSAVIQKLYKSEHLNRADNSVRSAATAKLGFYCDLQSLHSEDAITWSYFGPLVDQPVEIRTGFLNWLCQLLDLPWTDNSVCEIDLWRRVAHPKTLVSGGPELDFYLYGDQCVVFGEVKWLSKEGVHGPGEGDTQMHYRRNFLRDYGSGIFGDRGKLVLGVAFDQPVEKEVPDPVEGVETRALYWTDLCQWDEHPCADEFRRYYDWKQEHLGQAHKGKRGRAREMTSGS